MTPDPIAQLREHINRSLAQIQRRAIERIRQHQHELLLRDAERERRK